MNADNCLYVITAQMSICIVITHTLALIDRENSIDKWLCYVRSCRSLRLFHLPMSYFSARIFLKFIYSKVYPKYIVSGIFICYHLCP